LPNTKIDIIIPVLNDRRILDAIRSVRFFDDTDSVRILVMAGSSSEDFLEELRPKLHTRDLLSTEPDGGIFDALNKGLDLCQAPIVGWLGADDVFTGLVKASDVSREFQSGDADIVIYSTEYHNNGRITRKLSSWWSRRHLIPWGFHNPHFSTFLSKGVYGASRFPLSKQKPNMFSDITYFARLLIDYRVERCSQVCTYMAEGGSASGTLQAVKYNFQQRFSLYRHTFGLLNGLLAPIVCFGWKVSSALLCKLRPRKYRPVWQPTMPEASEAK